MRRESLTGLYRIPKHWSEDDRQYSLRIKRPIGLVLTHDQKIPYLDVLKDSWQEIIVRHYETSDQIDRPVRPIVGHRWFADQADAEATGRRHAQYLRGVLDFARANGVDPGRIYLTALNEGQGWAGEPWPWVVAYWVAFTVEVHSYGGRVLAGQVGVGQPGTIGGRRETARDYRIWAPLWQVLDPARDAFGFHGYYGYAGPWATWPKDKDPEEHLRWIDEAGANLQIPWQGPLIASESGLDPLVDEIAGEGWQRIQASTLEERADRYADMVIWADREYLKDPRMKAQLLFVEDYESNDWENMSTRHSVWHARYEHLLREGIEVEPWGDARVARWESPIRYYAQQACLFGYEREIATLIAIESGGNPWAQNDSTLATGLMQVLPKESPAWRGKPVDRPDAATLFHPGRNLRWGIGILRAGLAANNGDLAAALCAYYGAAGPGSPEGQYYLGKFAEAWSQLWPGQACPAIGGGPVDVPAPPPGSSLSQEAQATLAGFERTSQTVRLNRSAALQRQIRQDGFWATGQEGRIQLDGADCIAQRAEHPQTGEVRVYWCKVGDYAGIHFWKR